MRKKPSPPCSWGILLFILFISFTMIFLIACTREEATETGEGDHYLVNYEEAVLEEAVLLEVDPPEILQRSFELPVAQFALIPQEALPGHPVTIGYSHNFSARESPNLRAVLFDSRGRRLTRAFFFDLPREEGEPELKAAVFAVPSTALVGESIIRIESDYGIIRDLPFSIGQRAFYSETIALNQANTNLRTLPDPQRTAESDHIWWVLNTFGQNIYTWDSFVLPVSSTRRTSYYGSRRVFQYAGGGTDTSIHAGVDFGVPTGTEVLSSAAGRVIISRYRILTGYSVVLEHLPGVYSIYYHLDSLLVNEGEVLGAGYLLGYSGATGLATGPHLHWEVRVAGENADPDAFLLRPILDKNAILATLEP